MHKRVHSGPGSLNPAEFESQMLRPQLLPEKLLVFSPFCANLCGVTTPLKSVNAAIGAGHSGRALAL